jgi:DNA-binding ferritin-like protein
MAASKKKSAAKKASKKRRPRAAAKKAPKTQKPQAARKKVARKTVVSPAIAQLDERIAIVRNNLRELAEQAAASSGASTEELLSQRITEQEGRLMLLIKQRDELARQGS